MYEVIIIGSFIVLFAAAFMMAISALFYSLANFTSGEVNKLHTGSGVSNLFICQVPQNLQVQSSGII